MADEQQDEQVPGDAQGGTASGAAGTVAGGVESDSGPAGPGGTASRESVSVSGADLDVSEGPRQESDSALGAEQFEDGATEAGGTGGTNAGGAG